jgi:hypothetical protein
MGDIPGLGLAASNGACFAHPVSIDSSSRKWETFDYGVDWKAVKRVGCCVYLLIHRGDLFSATDTNPSHFDLISPYCLFFPCLRWLFQCCQNTRQGRMDLL